MKYLAFIPARAGSKGIPGKNKKLLGGKPLIQYTIEAAQQSKYINEIFISTDDDEIILLSRSLGIDIPYKRPLELALDTSDIMDAVFHVIEWKQKRGEAICDNLVLLQPTSPLRNSIDIDGAIEEFTRKNSKSLISINEMMEHPYECIKFTARGWQFLEKPKKKVIRRQDYSEKYYYINGAIYMANIEFLRENKAFIVEGVTDVYLMTQEKSIDIDETLDFMMAEFYLHAGP
ncbi:MAG: acylneuraminate cytidylyltransferase family protein [Candidatus Eremiobacteraeota bacterium]|nr:acylneuraminate cytidylyltransferase family protein [Candidatus Eremiobacteraeota bacterium]